LLPEAGGVVADVAGFVVDLDLTGLASFSGAEARARL